MDTLQDAQTDLPVFTNLVDLNQAGKACTRCNLWKTRSQVVFGEGPEHARLIIIGEAPGQLEDTTGRPFVGPSGKFLREELLRAGISPKDVYITSLLKSHPPKNKNPTPSQISACSPWLQQQLRLIKPDVIVSVGLFSTQYLLRRKGSLAEFRKTADSYENAQVIPTYHPAAVMRFKAKFLESFREDLARAAAFLEK